MSVTLNAKGTSVPTFTVGKGGMALGDAGTITPPAGNNLEVTLSEDNYLSIDAGTDGPALITASASQDLHINPAVGGGQYLILNSVRWPVSDGTSGQVLTTNGSGILSFQPITPNLGAITPTSVSLPPGSATAPTLFFVDDSNTGVWSPAANALSVTTDGSEKLRIDATGVVTPGADNEQPLGSLSLRWSVVYAGTGAINTSDENEKEQITTLSAAELSVATSLKGMIKKFKFKDAVVMKGSEARWHIGVIAQDVRSIFIANGLDPTEYGIFCEDTWWELDGNIVDSTTENATMKTRLGIRYDELLAFVIATL